MAAHLHDVTYDIRPVMHLIVIALAEPRRALAATGGAMTMAAAVRALVLDDGSTGVHLEADDRTVVILAGVTHTHFVGLADGVSDVSGKRGALVAWGFLSDAQSAIDLRNGKEGDESENDLEKLEHLFQWFELRLVEYCDTVDWQSVESCRSALLHLPKGVAVKVA